MNTSPFAWRDTADQQWAAEFESAAVSAPAARPEDTQAWLTQVYDAVTSSDQHAVDLFGPPDEAVADFLGSMPAERRAAVDLAGQASSDIMGAVLTSIGLTGIIVSVVYGARNGWQIEVSRSTAATALAALVVTVGVAATWSLYAAGIRSTAVGTVAGTAVIGIGSIAWAHRKTAMRRPCSPRP